MADEALTSWTSSKSSTTVDGKVQGWNFEFVMEETNALLVDRRGRIDQGASGSTRRMNKAYMDLCHWNGAAKTRENTKILNDVVDAEERK